MANLDGYLGQIVIGDDFDIERTVTNIPTGARLARAWMTVKHHEAETDDLALIRKEITTAPQPGVGQITDDGDTTLVGEIFFQLTNIDTAGLAPRHYAYDIQVKTDTAKIYTVERGMLLPLSQVTRDLT